MHYSLGQNGIRTDAYRFTVPNKNDENLIALKKHIKSINKDTRYHCRARKKISEHDKLYKIRIMARGPRKSDEYLTYDDCIKLNVNPEYYVGTRAPLISKDGVVHWNQYHSLRHEFGTSFDIYVAEDTCALSQLDDEISFGITSNIRRKLVDLDNEIRKLKHQAYKEANNIEVFRRDFAH